jgi:acyl carrier protein
VFGERLRVPSILEIAPTVESPMPPHALEPEPQIAEIVHRLLRDRSIDREFSSEDNLRDVGLTSLDMTSLVFAVEADFAIEIPDDHAGELHLGRIDRPPDQHAGPARRRTIGGGLISATSPPNLILRSHA